MSGLKFFKWSNYDLFMNRVNKQLLRKISDGMRIFHRIYLWNVNFLQKLKAESGKKTSKSPEKRAKSPKKKGKKNEGEQPSAPKKDTKLKKRGEVDDTFKSIG